MSYSGYRGGIGDYVNPEQFAQGFNAAVPIEESMKIENDQAALAQQRTMAPMQTELARYKLQGAKMDSDLAQSTYENTLIANAARTSMDDPEKWDANFQALADKGITGARQFVGQYSPQTADRVAQAYDMQSPIARASRPPAATPATPTDYDRLFAKSTPDQVQQVSDNTGRAMDLLSGVHDQATWETAKAAAAKAGMPLAARLGPYNPLVVRQLYDHLLGIHSYLAQRTMGAATGEPQPLVPSKTQNLGGTLYDVDTQTPTGQATATPIAHTPDSTFVGMDASGHPVYHDVHGGLPGEGPQDTEGPYRVTPKASAGTQTFDRKLQAAVAVGMSQADALQFANGRKAASDDQVQQMAAKMAQGDLHTAMLAGEQIDDPNAYIQQHTALWQQQLHAGQAAPRQGQAAPSGQFKARDGQSYDVKQTLAAARAAIQRNPKARAAIIARLRQNGLNAAGL